MLLRNLEGCLWHVETTLSDLAPVGKYLLSDLAQRHVKVVLTGEGSDEVFLGYEVFRDAANGGNAVSPSQRALVAKWFSRLRGNCSLLPHSRSTQGSYRRDERSNNSQQIAGRAPVVQLQYRRLVTHLPHVILCAYGDRTEMAHSIEGRVPFLDHHLFEVALEIPPEHKIRGGIEKYIVREDRGRADSKGGR